MRTISVSLYRYSELSEAARANARHNFATNAGFPWAAAAMKSIKALANHFGCRVQDYEIHWMGSSYSWMKFDMTKAVDEHEIDKKLYALGDGKGECRLTGAGYDEDAIDGFRNGWRDGERRINKLLEMAFRNWLFSCREEYDKFYSDEDGEFGEYAEANQFEYYSDGSYYTGERLT